MRNRHFLRISQRIGNYIVDKKGKIIYDIHAKDG